MGAFYPKARSLKRAMNKRWRGRMYLSPYGAKPSATPEATPKAPEASRNPLTGLNLLQRSRFRGVPSS